MLKKKLNGKALLVFATAATMASMAAATPILAKAPDDGQTNVSYDNRKIIPDGNAQYGIVIPSAIQFYDADLNKGKSADLEIVGINGFDLTHWSSLDVAVTVASENAYKLTKGVESVTYTLQYGTTPFTSTSEAQPITQHLGVGGSTKTTVEGTAKLTSIGKTSGLYTDQLTYAFSEIDNTPAENTLTVQP